MARRARSESSSPPRSAARRARAVSRPRATSVSGRRAKSVFRTSGHTAEPASSGLKAKSTSVRAGARRAKTPSVVLPVSEPESVGREAKSVAVPLRPELPSLRRLLCLRCAKRAVSVPSSSCSFDKGRSKKCSYCRSQKSKCFPVSTSFLLPITLLTLVDPPLLGRLRP
jgi:hypothetical protein